MSPESGGTGSEAQNPHAGPEFLPPGHPGFLPPGQAPYVPGPVVPDQARYPLGQAPFSPGPPPLVPGQPPYPPGPSPFAPGQPEAWMNGSPYARPAPAPPPDVTPEDERVPLRYGIAAIVATVVLAVVAVAVGVWATSPRPGLPAASVWTPAPSTISPTRVATTPRPTPSAIQPGNCSGTRAGTPGWTSTVPSGWSCAYQPGAELRIIDGRGAVIQVEATTGTPMSACTTRLSALGTAARLADTRWGGRAATTTSLTNNGWTYVLRCTTSNTYTYVMAGAILGGSVDTLVAAEEALAQSWVWKA